MTPVREIVGPHPVRRLLLVVLLLLQAPSPAWGAPGICTATTGGAIAAVTWQGAGCRDLLDSCPGCPDTDDVLDVNGQVIDVDVDATVDRLMNVTDFGRITVRTGATFTVANVGEIGGSVWSCARCSFTVEPGATVLANAGNFGVVSSQRGRVVIQGSVIAKGLIDVASPPDDTHLEIRFQEPLSGVAPGDLIRIDGGLARGYTFEVTAVSATDPHVLTVDTTRRDPAGLVARVVPTPGADARHWTVPDGGPDAVPATDEAYLGKFLLDDAHHYHPIVSVDADPAGGENDTFGVFADAPALAGGFQIAYGFEAGGDPATIFRPARMGATGPNRFNMRFENGAKVSIAHADFDGIAIVVGDIDNANRPLEYFDLSDTGVHDLPNMIAVQTEGDGGGLGAKNLLLERLDVFKTSGSAVLNLTGHQLTLRDTMIRDMQTLSGYGVGVNPNASGATLIEDVSILRVASAVASGYNERRPDVTIRRLWAVGRGRRGVKGAAGVIWGGRLIDPFDPSPGHNDGRSRTFNSVLWSHGNAEISMPGRSIGQNVPAVNVVTGYSGSGTPYDNSDGMYRGDSWYSVHTRHGRHGQSECTWCVANITSLNQLHGLSSVSEGCVYATCTPTPFPRRLRGNLSFGNGQNALRDQEHDRTVEITHNTLLGRTGDLPAAWFDPYDPFTEPSCTDNDTPDSCGPDTGNGTARPPWWTEPPAEQPNATLRDNIIGDVPPPLFALGRAGIRFTPGDLLHTWNYYFNAWNPDLGEFAPAAADELENQADPFVDGWNNDYRLAAPVPGSDERNMGAGYAGILADANAMPPVYATLRDDGVLLTLRNGELESVDGDLDGKAEFIDFDMTGSRVSFHFATTPACADPRDCANLVLRALPLDGSPPVTRTLRVPVEGSATDFSVAETAFALGWSSIERPARVRAKLVMGVSESAEGCWSWTSPPYHIGEYAIPPTTPADADRDGVRDSCDLCPTLKNADQADTDGDLVGNVCDNCRNQANPDQTDTDHDHKGDACDADDDGDGLLDTVETNTGVFVSPSNTGTDPRRSDTDGDGYTDRTEVQFHSDPLDAGSVPESLPTLSGLGGTSLVLLLLLGGARVLRLRRGRA